MAPELRGKRSCAKVEGCALGDVERLHGCTLLFASVTVRLYLCKHLLSTVHLADSDSLDSVTYKLAPGGLPKYLPWHRIESHHMCWPRQGFFSKRTLCENLARVTPSASMSSETSVAHDASRMRVAAPPPLAPKPETRGGCQRLPAGRTHHGPRRDGPALCALHVGSTQRSHSLCRHRPPPDSPPPVTCDRYMAVTGAYRQTVPRPF